MLQTHRGDTADGHTPMPGGYSSGEDLHYDSNRQMRTYRQVSNVRTLRQSAMSGPLAHRCEACVSSCINMSVDVSSGVC